MRLCSSDRLHADAEDLGDLGQRPQLLVAHPSHFDLLRDGYGLQLWPILQDMSQLKDLYGARANTFVANAGVLQTFGVNDFETAKWLSQMIGRETTGYQTESHKPGDAPSTSYNVTARDLMTPDEIMQIPPHVQLLRVQGKPVIIARKLRYFADREFDGLHRSPDAQPISPKSQT